MRELERLTTVPSSITEDENFLYVEAIAIKATKIPRSYGTLVLTEEELAKSYKTFEGKPFIKDHYMSVDSVIGQVISSEFKDGKVFVKARIIKKGNEKLVSLIKEGIVKKLSAGFERDLEKLSDGEYLAKNIVFHELSLVIDPAIEDASILRREDMSQELMRENEKLKQEVSRLQEELSQVKGEREKLRQELEVLKKEVERLKPLAEMGKAYRESLERDAEKFIKVVEGEDSPLLSLIQKAELSELQKLVETFRKKAELKLSPSSVQGTNLSKPVDILSYQELKELEKSFMGGK